MAIIHYVIYFLLIFVGIIPLSIEVSIKEHQKFCYPAQGQECLEAKGLGRSYSSWPPICTKGHDQSPIDLPKSLKVPSPIEILLDMKSYNQKEFHIGNNGHTIKISPINNSSSNKANTTIIKGATGKHTYVFAQAHFHWGPNNSAGSEHKIGGKKFALEMHLVHFSDLYSGMKHAAESRDHASLSVIGTVFEASDTNPDNPLFKTINDYFPLKEGDTKNVIMNIVDFLPKKGATFYRYLGSLTTPDCEEIVLWNVFDQPTPISTKDMEKFRKATDSHDKLMSDNYRELQKDYSRNIEYFKLL